MGGGEPQHGAALFGAATTAATGDHSASATGWPRLTLPVTLVVFFLGLWWSARAAHKYRVWYMQMKDQAKAKDLLAKHGSNVSGTSHEDAVVKAACPFANIGGGGKNGVARCPVSGNTAADVAAATAAAPPVVVEEEADTGKTTSTVLEPGYRDGYNPHVKDGTDEGEIMQAPSAPAKKAFYRTNNGTLQTTEAPDVPPRPTRRRPHKAS